jgi:hypothetical protein
MKVRKSLLFWTKDATRFRLRGKSRSVIGTRKRSKKNFDSHDVTPAVPHPTGIKVFFASFLFTKKKTLTP